MDKPPKLANRTASEHRIAIQKSDGEIEVVEADEYRAFQCTKDCVMFWAMLVTCAGLLIVGLTMLILKGTGDPQAPMYSAMASLGAGVLIPSPNYASAFKVARPE